MTNQSRAWKILMGLALTFCVSVSHAEDEWSGDLSAGFQTNLQTTPQAKFQEYLSMPDYGIMDGSLNYDGSHGIFGLKWDDHGQYNRKASLGLEYDKGLTVDANFQQYQHLYSTTATSIFTEAAPNLYILPAAVQLANEGQTSQQVYQNLINAEAVYGRPITLGLHDSVLGGKATYQVSPELSVQIGANQKWRAGTRNIWDANSEEMPQQLDETTTNGNVSAEYDGKGFAVRANYDISAYNNNLPSMIYSNLTVYQDVPGGASNLNQLSLAPSNMANRVGLSAEVDVAPKTRLAADSSLGYATQNMPFLPYTINNPANVTGVPAGMGPVNLASSLPAQSLNGTIQIFTQNYVLTSRPVDALVVSARYKDYEQADMSPNILFPGYVHSDAGSFSVGPVQNNNYGWVDQRISGTATYSILKELSLNGEFDDDWLNPQSREVQATNEQTWKGGFDLKPIHEIGLKSDYTYANRVATQTDFILYTAAAGAGGQSIPPGMRRFDLADRTVQDWSTRLQLNATKEIWVACKYTTGKENFNSGSEDLTGGVAGNEDQQYGLLSDDHDFWTFTASWQPLEGLSLNGTLDLSSYDYFQRGAANTAQQISTKDWTLDDRENATYLTLTGTYAVSSKVDVDASYTWTNSHGIYIEAGQYVDLGQSMDSEPPLPQTMYWMEDYKLGITYHINDNWSLTANYLIEVFNENDFQNDILATNPVSYNPTTGAFVQLFLGGTPQPYTAQVMTVSMSAKL